MQARQGTVSRLEGGTPAMQIRTLVARADGDQSRARDPAPDSGSDKAVADCSDAAPGAHPPLCVFMNGRRVGTLARAANGAIDFRYAEDWLAWDNAIPVSLSLPFRGKHATSAEAVSIDMVRIA